MLPPNSFAPNHLEIAVEDVFYHVDRKKVKEVKLSALCVCISDNISPTDESFDTIRINDLVVQVSLFTGAQWALETEEPVEQPVSITLSIFYDVSEVAQTDNLDHSIDYAGVVNCIRNGVNLKTFLCIQDLSCCICETISEIPALGHILDGLEVYLNVKQLRSPLHTKTVGIEHFAKFSQNGSWIPQKITHRIEDLVGPTTIGVRVEERLEKQDVVANLSIDTADKGLSREDWIHIRGITRMVYEEICTSSFLTLEALTSYIASETLSALKSYRLSPTVSVKIAKPSALPNARSSEVEIIRRSSNYVGLTGEGEKEASSSDFERIAVAFERNKEDNHVVAIALGSNLGDSFQNIEFALRLLEAPRDIMGDDDAFLDTDPFIDVVDTSFLYESAPMYVTEQPSFINCACIIETNISPTALLRVVKKIENIVGRVPSIRNGPRAVDLDIIFYDDDVVDTRPTWKNSSDLEGELVVPHPLLQEREFVLRPLNDMIPDYMHPILKKSVEVLFNQIFDPLAPPMNKVIPYPELPTSPLSSPYLSVAPVPKTLTHWSYAPSSSKNVHFSQDPKPWKTHLMATLNVTPDSFSDGSKYDSLPAAIEYVATAVESGATIIDVGGYSTRPKAAFVSTEEEIDRVVPAIRALRNPDSSRDLLAKASSSRSSPSPSSATDGGPDAFSDDVLSRMSKVPISIDTFRWEVAEAALRAGANCINDVYAFTGPHSWGLSSSGDIAKWQEEEDYYMAGMKRVAREYAVPVILMHSRGDAGSNKDYSQYDYAISTGGATVEGVRVELGNKVEKIVKGKGGVRRWFVVADPGVGFSKSVDGNLEVLRGAQGVVADLNVGNGIALIGNADPNNSRRNPLRGYPFLIGTSRKSFLGIILAQDSPENDPRARGRTTEPKERGWATAAAVSCAVQQRALIVRVHDVKEMMDVVKVADALWR